MSRPIRRRTPEDRVANRILIGLAVGWVVIVVFAICGTTYVLQH